MNKSSIAARLMTANSLLAIALATAAGLNGASAATPALQCQPASLNVGKSKEIQTFVFCRTDSLVGESAQPITAQKVLDVSVQNSAYLKSQNDLVDSAIYSLKSANGNWWPNVSMSNSSYLFVNTNGNNNPVTTGCNLSPSTAGSSFNPFNGSSNCSATSSYGQAYPVITITWNFINPSRYPQIAGAMKSIKLAQSQANQSTQQLQMSVLKSYGSYLFSGYQLGELSRLIAIEQRMLATTKLLVQQRGLPRFALSQQSRNLLSYQARIEEAIANQQQAYLELTTGMQKTSADNPSILPDLNSLVLREWAYNMEESIQMAMVRSEQLKQLELQKGIATDSANQTRGQILPTIGLLGYVTYQGTDASGVHTGLLSNYAGLQVTWNLFDGYTTKNQAISSDRQATSYAAQLEAAKIQLRMQTKSKLQTLSNLKNQIGIYLNDIKHAELIANDLRRRQSFGITNQADVLQAEQSLHESRLQLISTIGSYVVAYTELAHLCGVNPLT
jgi:outer membrane protein TolC